LYHDYKFFQAYLHVPKAHLNQTIEKVSRIAHFGKMKNYTNLLIGAIVEAIRYLRKAIWKVCWGNLFVGKVSSLLEWFVE